MKAFVINLPKDTERRKFMEQQLYALNIPYEVISATVGTELTSAARDTIYDDTLARCENGHPLSNTQIACADSHRRVYERIIEQRLPYALVLEDDVQLDSRITQVIEPSFVSASHADWIQIDYVPMNEKFLSSWWSATKQRSKESPLFIIYAIVKAPWLILWGLIEYGREQLLKESAPRVGVFPRPLYLASAYIITAAGAEKILPLTKPIRFAADRIQNQARLKQGLVLRGVIPLLAHQARSKFESNLIYDNE